MADHNQLKLITMRALSAYSTAKKDQMSIKDFFVAKHAARTHNGTKKYIKKLAGKQ